MDIRLEAMEKEKINKGIDDFINSWHEAISPNTNPNYVLVEPTASQRSSLKRQMENLIMDKRIRTYQEMLDLEEDFINQAQKESERFFIATHNPTGNGFVGTDFFKSNKRLKYICKDNGNIIRFQLLDGEIDELLISAPGENSEIVISYKDLKKAIKKVKKNDNR